MDRSLLRRKLCFVPARCRMPEAGCAFLQIEKIRFLGVSFLLNMLCKYMQIQSPFKKADQFSDVQNIQPSTTGGSVLRSVFREIVDFLLYSHLPEQYELTCRYCIRYISVLLTYIFSANLQLQLLNFCNLGTSPQSNWGPVENITLQVFSKDDSFVIRGLLVR